MIRGAARAARARRGPENGRFPAVRAVARFLLRGRAVPRAAPDTPSVLLLARPAREKNEDLFADIAEREDLCLLAVATAAAANRAIAEMPVALVVACPEMPADAIDEVLSCLARVRPGTPVLAIRTRQAPEPAGWSRAGVAVLRMPLLAGVLSRSIDVVLGMNRARRTTRRGR